MASVEKIGKTVAEALQAASVELGVKPEDLEYEVLEEARHGFLGFIGNKMARVRATVIPPRKDPVEKADDFLKAIFSCVGVQVNWECTKKDEQAYFELHGENLGILIGRHGQTLDALQYLTNLAANRKAEERVHIVLDVENYRTRRIQTLEQLAQRVAERVKKMGRPVTLEPMSPQERKVIHVALQHDASIVTVSSGDDPYRKVTIALKR